MPKPQTLEVCRKYLFKNPDDEKGELLSPQMNERLIRIRAAFVFWTEQPMKSEVDIVRFLQDNHQVKQSQSYDDLVIIKSLMGNVKSAGKDWHRYRFNAMTELAWEVAYSKKDAKAMSMIIREYGKNNQLHIPDALTMPWEDLIPHLVEPTEDPTVIGLKPIPNIRQVAKDLIDKYTGEIAENVTAVNIEHEELEADDSKAN